MSTSTRHPENSPEDQPVTRPSSPEQNLPTGVSTPEPEKKANARPKFGPRMQHGPGQQSVHEKAVNFGPSLRRLFGQMRPDRLAIGVVLAMGVISVLFTVIGPKVIGRATDAIFAGVVGRQLPAGVSVEQVVATLRSNGQDSLADLISGMRYLVPGQGIDFELLGRIALVGIALYLSAGLLSFLQFFLLNKVVQRSVYRMRGQLSAKLERLPLSYFDRQPRGELLSRVTNDVDNISQTLQQTLSQLLSSVLTIIGVTVMMFSVSWHLALVTLLILPVSAVVSVLIGKRSQTRFTTMWAKTGELNGQIEEAFTGHALVKVFGRRAEVGERFGGTNGELFKASFGAQFISALLMPVNMFIGNLNYVAIAVIGGLRVASGSMPLGDVQAFIQYSRMFTQPIGQVASMANLLQSGVASAERVFEVLDAPEQEPEQPGSLPSPLRGDVQFSDVHFSYQAAHPLIEGLNLHAAPGETVAIVGPTGAGKTTLVNLLMRFYEIQQGTISLDGVDITTVPRADLRRQFGMVLQDTWLFKGSIVENIAYGREGATREEVIEAAKAAYVDRFVHTLPDGYETVIDDEGSNLSAGERQLVTIARAFIADPAVLILDEATSSVDTRTEVLVQRAMNKLRSGRTSFVIAHRLSTIRDADTIVVMQHGAIVDSGSHQELLSRPGPYLELYRSQFSSAAA